VLKDKYEDLLFIGYWAGRDRRFEGYPARVRGGYYCRLCGFPATISHGNPVASFADCPDGT